MEHRAPDPIRLVDRVVTSPVGRGIRGACQDLTELLFPALCVLCEREPGTLCAACRPELAGHLMRPFRAEEAAAALPLDPTSGQPLPVVAAARYDPVVARALLAFKDHGRTGLTTHLRPAVYRALRAVPDLVPGPEGPGGGVTGPMSATLVPVPGSTAGFRRRGYDPVAELLDGPTAPGWTVAPGTLAHRRRSAQARRSSHAGSSSRDRRRRQAERFRPTVRCDRLGTAPVLLFDDVMTTGSTLAAAWQALHRAGLQPVAAVVLAAVAAPDDTRSTQPLPGVNARSSTG